VIGGRRAGRQALRSFVGKVSSGQVASDEDRMAVCTSSWDAGRKESRMGGLVGGEVKEEAGEMVCKLAESVVILSLKNLRKDCVSWDGEIPDGSDKGSLRESRELRVVQSWRGLSCWREISERK